jgi:hypothetical protein
LRAGFLLLAGACAMAGSPVVDASSTGATYAMPASVLDAGAGDMSSANYRLRSSVGEPVAGVTSTGSSYKLSAGFVSAVFVPIIQLTPAKLDFGSQTVGVASAAQAMQVTNLGAAPLVIANVTVSGDFAQTNTCTGPLQGGTGCTLSVTFRPTTAGALNGTLSFTSNAPGSPTQIALTGTGTAAAPAPANTPAVASTGAGSLCAPPVPPARTSAPVALTQDITVRDTVAKGHACTYSAAVTSGQTYVLSVTGIIGAAQLRVFNDAARKQPTACLSPSNLSSSIYTQPADCTFVATGSTVYASVTGTSYLATGNNSYNIRLSPHFDAAPASEGTVKDPIVIQANKPYGGSAGAVSVASSNYSYYKVDTAGTSGDVVISVTGLTGVEDINLRIYENADFSGMLSNPSCFVGEARTYPESCILPAGKAYYLMVMSTANAGGPFTLMVDTRKP